MEKVILHIDFDSYFASCEQQFNPTLRDKPIGVTAQNGRTCIIAASREAKKLGIKSPSRTWEAVQKVPTMIFVPASFEKYWQITQKFIDICKDFSPFVEIFSLDEVFMDVTQTQYLFKDKYELIEKLKDRIANEIGEYITVSVGISHNKLLAKLASGKNKPNGLFEITHKNLDDVYKDTALTDFCGIGERIAVRLRRMGLYTPFDIREIPLSRLKEEFGNFEANFLKNLAKGLDSSTVISYALAPLVKSVGRNYCLSQNEYEKRIVFQNLYELCEEIAIKLRRLKMSAKTAGIYLGGNKSIHGRKTITEYFSSGQQIFSICNKILDENRFYLNENDYIRRINVWATGLEESSNISLSLFDKTNKQTKILETVDKINNKFGDHTIRNGFLLYADKLTTVPNGFMADKFERTKLAESVTY
jgi:DNA polymerase-4